MAEAGYEEADRPCVLLLHGFPELAYSWRKIMLPLAEAGYHVIAPDQRGYGLTTGWDDNYDGDVASFRMLNLVTDALALVFALGHKTVAAVAGHDFGSPVAGFCALIRPDVFQRLVVMSAPFTGAPRLPFDSAGQDAPPAPPVSLHAMLDTKLAELERPRKHYQWYYSTPQANSDMLDAPQGLRDFLRAYYHSKSADWPDNKPFHLAGFDAAELAKMPTYYIMDRNMDMAQTVADYMPGADEAGARSWLTDEELSVYCNAFTKTGFQGGLNWYRCITDPRYLTELRAFAGQTVDVPACYIAGVADWGTFQAPGSLELMRDVVCTNLTGIHRIDGAGHWVQQEQAAKVTELLLEFLSAA